MAAAPEDRAPPHQEIDTEAAEGGRFGVRAPTFAETAERLLDNGYAPLPIRVGEKRPAPARWSQVAIDAEQIEQWVRDHPRCGVGLRTGALVGVDVDIEDPDLAHDCAALIERRLGPTLLRVGRWPRRLLL